MSGEHEREHIEARDVRPGDVVWNAYGGARGRAEVASEPRERADGTVEFDCADGRTGHFRPQFRLRLDRAAMERRDAEQAAAADPFGPRAAHSAEALEAAMTDLPEGRRAADREAGG